MLLHNKIRALHVHLGSYFRTGLVGKQSWQIFPDFINELCRDPPRDKRAKILAVNWTPGHTRKEMRSRAEFTKVSGCTDMASIFHTSWVLVSVLFLLCPAHSIMARQDVSDLLLLVRLAFGRRQLRVSRC